MLAILIFSQVFGTATSGMKPLGATDLVHLLAGSTVNDIEWFGVDGRYRTGDITAVFGEWQAYDGSICIVLEGSSENDCRAYGRDERGLIYQTQSGTAPTSLRLIEPIEVNVQATQRDAGT
jgi:hypothetical protein